MIKTNKLPQKKTFILDRYIVPLSSNRMNYGDTTTTDTTTVTTSTVTSTHIFNK